MPLNSEVIIADTSCLILLTNIDEFELLNKMAKEVFITPEIYQEFGKSLPNWLKIKEPKNKQYQKILEREIDLGEASAIILALELPGSILIIDDLKGRKLANELNLNYSGTFGLLLRAKQEGILPSLKPIVERIKRTNFRFNNTLLELILKEAGE